LGQPCGHVVDDAAQAWMIQHDSSHERSLAASHIDDYRGVCEFAGRGNKPGDLLAVRRHHGVESRGEVGVSRERFPKGPPVSQGVAGHAGLQCLYEVVSSLTAPPTTCAARDQLIS